VDDAIVVVENVERVMDQERLSPHDATEKSMTQITGALVGIAMVLSAVFVPMAFFGGSTGVIYRQFSVTIVAAMGLSVLVALTLTPALCATILKPIKHDKAEKGFFGWFNRTFNKGAEGATSAVGYMTALWKRLHRPLRRDHCRRRLRIPESSDCLYAGRRPGFFDGPDSAAGRLNPRADSSCCKTHAGLHAQR